MYTYVQYIQPAILHPTLPGLIPHDRSSVEAVVGHFQRARPIKPSPSSGLLPPLSIPSSMVSQSSLAYREELNILGASKPTTDHAPGTRGRVEAKIHSTPFYL